MVAPGCFAERFKNGCRVDSTNLNGDGDLAHAISVLDGCSLHNDIQEWSDSLSPNVASSIQFSTNGLGRHCLFEKCSKHQLTSVLCKLYAYSQAFDEAKRTRRGGGCDGFEQGCKPHALMMLSLSDIGTIWHVMREERFFKCDETTCMPANKKAAQNREQDAHDGGEAGGEHANGDADGEIADKKKDRYAEDNKGVSIDDLAILAVNKFRITVGNIGDEHVELIVEFL